MNGKCMAMAMLMIAYSGVSHSVREAVTAGRKKREREREKERKREKGKSAIYEEA